MAKPPPTASDPLLQPPPPAPYLEPQPAAYVLIPVRVRRLRLRRPCRCLGPFLLSSSSTLLSLALAAALLASALFFLYPSGPDLRVSRLRLDRISVATSPGVALTISIGLELRVRNPAFFSLDYRSLVASLGYRGHKLGAVTSEGGRVRARGVSYVDAELHLDGIQVIDQVIYLIADLARGSIPLETTTEVKGRLHLLFFDVPVEGRISCAANVNPENQTIVQQDCYPV